MKTKLLTVTESVRVGSSLHLALEQGKLIDPLAVEMVRVGEQSSALPDMLDHVATCFDQEVEKATTAVTSLIGPVLILAMGVIVLILLLAVYIPLFNAGNAVNETWSGRRLFGPYLSLAGLDCFALYSLRNFALSASARTESPLSS